MSEPLTAEEIEQVRGNLAAAEEHDLRWAFVIVYDQAKRYIATIDALQAKVEMYEAALKDKFGPDVLECFGEPPDGWLRQL